MRVISWLKVAMLAACGWLLPGLAVADQAADEYATYAFVRNTGQFRADVAYAARLRSSQIFVLNDGRVVHALPIERTGANSMSAWVVLEGLRGSNVVPRGSQLAPQRVTWLRTATSSPTSDESSYSALDWRNAWPGIDMRLQIVEDRTERVFLVAPGADPKRIALTYDGVHFALDENGGLIARAGEGGLSLSAPVAFQDTAQGRVPVDVRYVVNAGGTRVSFELGAFDARLPLTIDPVLQSTYFGFGGASSVAAMTVDPVSGDLIVAGTSAGLGVPGVAGGFQTLHGGLEIFVARIDAKLQRVIQATYFGITLPSDIDAVAVHPQTGEIYVAGFTESADLPGAGGGARPVQGGARNDGFVSRFSPDLRQLRQTTFTNQGLKMVYARDLAINATTGDVYVAGEGVGTAYVLRFNRQLTTQLGRVMLEGNTSSRAFSVAISQNTGDVYVGGGTNSTVFPQMAGGADTVYGGTFDEGEAVFVARFNADLSQHLQSTYLSDVTPGQQPTVGSKMSPLLAVHPGSDEVYVAGYSVQQNLSASGGAQPSFGGGLTDVVITRLSPDLRQRRGATYFGGSSDEELGAMAFTPDGAQLYLTGITFSRDIPGTAGGVQPTAPFVNTPAAFVARFSASLSTLNQSTYFTSDYHVLGMSLAVHPSSGEVYFGGQCREGIVETAGGLQPEYAGGSTAFGTGCMVRLDATLAANTDLDPDAFSFTDQFAVAPGAEVTSAPVRIEGITVPVVASVMNGSFNIDGGPFDSTAREVRRGQMIRVRHTASAGTGVATASVFTIASRSDTFTSVSASGVDSAPNAISFAARGPVAMNIDVESAPLSVSGINTPAAISISNGEYSINGGDFTTAAGTINGGQSVVVRHHSANTAGTHTDSILTIGGVTVNFRSTTDTVDSAVHPFQFLDIANMTPDFDAGSEPIVVMGITVPVPVSVSGAEWSTDGINFQGAPGMVSNLTPIVLRRRSGAPGVTVTATLTVGDQSDDWVMRQPQPGDTTPGAFAFATVTNAEPHTNVVSNDITITEVDVPVWINVPNGEFFDPVTGLYQNSGYLSNGDTTRLRVLTGRQAGASYIVSVRIGSTDTTWEVRSAGGDSIPDAFDFTDQTGVATGTEVTSNGVTLGGLIGDATASVTGCELSVNFNAFSGSSVRVVSGDNLRLRMTASATAATIATCTIDVGGVTDQFRVTTASLPGGGSGGGSGSGGGGGGGGSWDWASLAALGLLLLSRLGAFRARRLA